MTPTNAAASAPDAPTAPMDSGSKSKNAAPRMAPVEKPTRGIIIASTLFLSKKKNTIPKSDSRLTKTVAATISKSAIYSLFFFCCISNMSPSVMPLPCPSFTFTAVPEDTSCNNLMPSSFSSLCASFSSGSVFSCSTLSKNECFSLILSARTSRGRPILFLAAAMTAPKPSTTSISTLPARADWTDGSRTGWGARSSFPAPEQSWHTVSFAPSTSTIYPAPSAPQISHSMGRTPRIVHLQSPYL